MSHIFLIEHRIAAGLQNVSTVAHFTLFQPRVDVCFAAHAEQATVGCFCIRKDYIFFLNNSIYRHKSYLVHYAVSVVTLAKNGITKPTLTSGCGRRVCYYTNWAQYRPGKGRFVPENVDPFLCTHVVYAFANLSGNHLVAFEWNDERTQWSSGM